MLSHWMSADSKHIHVHIHIYTLVYTSIYHNIASRRFKKSSTQPFSLKVFPFHSFSFVMMPDYILYCIYSRSSYTLNQWILHTMRLYTRTKMKEKLIRRIVVITHQFCAGRSTFQSCEREAHSHSVIGYG